MEQIVIYSESLKEAVFAFTEKCFSSLGKAFEPEGRHAYYHHLEEGFDRFWCLVLDGAVVGTVGIQRLDDQTAELKALYLSEEFRGRGLGYRLLDTAVSFAKGNGYRRVVLDSMSKYESASRLYTKYGFEETARYNENPYADIFMELHFKEEQRMDDLIIRLETEKDYRAVEELTREAFWNVYKPGADEHYYVHMMRNHPDFIPELAFVLEQDGKIVGNIMYTKAWLEDEDGNRKEILSFGPICIAPELQRRHLGKVLIEHSFEVARGMGYDVNINFGNPGNYVARGFVSCKKKDVSFGVPGNYPTALLVCELVPGALAGKKWMFIPSTAADCCEDTVASAAFDATFSPKEKLWKPSQEEYYIYKNSSVVR